MLHVVAPSRFLARMYCREQGLDPDDMRWIHHREQLLDWPAEGEIHVVNRGMITGAAEHAMNYALALGKAGKAEITIGFTS